MVQSGEDLHPQKETDICMSETTSHDTGNQSN
jgi:hypothetical protein